MEKVKYCPHCGASVMDGAAFCMACGKRLPKAQHAIQRSISLKKSKPENRPTKNNPVPGHIPDLKRQNQRPRTETHGANPPAKPPTRDTGYDGYYDDVQPEDRRTDKGGLDRGLIKQLIWIAAGVVVIAVLSIVVMNVV